MKHPILGLHLVTATVGDAQADLSFCIGVLGLRWYPFSFMEEVAKNEPGISSGLQVLDQDSCVPGMQRYRLPRS